ncbi:UNVERIFIED_CONTAM: hypothetical protein C7454_1311, partial [Acidovorax defluvii]
PEGLCTFFTSHRLRQLATLSAALNYIPGFYPIKPKITFLQTFFSTTQIFPTGTPLNSEACDYSMEI